MAKDIKGLTPICNMEAEQSVLGAILVRPEMLDEVASILQVGDFYREAHGRIYEAMVDLYDKREPVDLVTVCALLKERNQLDKVGGPVFLAGLSEQVGFATNGPHYAKIVRDKAIIRRFQTTMQQLTMACQAPIEDVAEFMDAAEAQVFQVAEAQQVEAKSLEELVPAVSAGLEQVHENQGKMLGLPSGFTDIDRLTGGFQKSDLIIIAARPSMGKTALALNIAHYAASKAGAPTVIFSMEMSTVQLVQRLMASNAKIDHSNMKQGLLTGQEWAKLTKVQGELMDAPIFICDKAALTPIEIRSQARRLKARHDIKLVIVDYLQLAHDPRAKSRELEIANISRALKALAKELDIPVIALSQLNREVEKRDNKRPQLSDLRESGAIEQDADLIFFIYRDEVYHEDSPQRGTAEVRLAKQRNGRTGQATLSYLSEYISFKNHQHEESAA